MKINSMTCPNCSAKLEVMDGTDTFYCNYCGTKLVVEQREDILEAKVAVEEMAHKERMADKEYEHKETIEKMKNEEDAKDNRRMIFMVIFFFGLVFLMICITDVFEYLEKKQDNTTLQNTVSIVQGYIDSGDYAQARYYANQIQSSTNDDTWDSMREGLLTLIDEKEAESRKAEAEGAEAVTVTVPMSADDIVGSNRNDIYQILSDAGFINITMTELSESAGLFKSGGGIKVVSIAGLIEFEKGDTFLSTDEVILYYYKE